MANYLLPLRDCPFNYAWNAPSMRIGDLFAAFSKSETGDRSDNLYPAFKKSFDAHRFDCALVSATAVTLVDLGDNLMERLRTTVGCSEVFTFLHSFLMNGWCFKGIGFLLLAKLEIWPRVSSGLKDIKLDVWSKSMSNLSSNRFHIWCEDVCSNHKLSLHKVERMCHNLDSRLS